jgi:hypothetical protein
MPKEKQDISINVINSKISGNRPTSHALYAHLSNSNFLR